MKTFTKQPADVLGYDIDFTAWFAQIPDDFLESATCSVVSATDGSPSGLTIQSIVLVNDTTGVARTAKVWLSGGLDAVTYKLQLLATTHDSRVKDVDFQMKVKET